MPIDPTVDPFILEGRVVTMEAGGVIDDGAVYVRAGEIVDARPRGEARPAGFSGAARVRTGGTIYPGMIELHNHLSYNVIPIWEVPTKYAHNGSWRGTDEYRREVTKPAQVLANTAGMIEALIRFVECRCLLGGVTTSQGITLQAAPGIKKFYKGLIRNVEQPLDDRLPKAGTSVANPDTGGADAYLAKLQANTCYLQHLSEGIGATPRGWFLRLQRPGGDWAITDALCGIHSTALTADDFTIIGVRHGSMVWSPLSNLLLYGATTDVQAAKAAGVPIALGSDWGPSGSKNLLGELKVAWLVSEELGGVFSAEELVEMVTITPARICKWDHLLGSIAPGRLADLFVLNGRTGDPFDKVVDARETSVTLVMIGGIPRAGQRRMMRDGFGLETEVISIGDSERVLNLAPDAGVEDLLDGITLTAATTRLREGLADLPALAADIDSAMVAVAESGAVDLVALPDGPPFRVVLDFDEDDAQIDPTLGLAAGDLADWVEPMTLERVTVAGDTEFLRKMVRARNLPEYVKRGLPPLYGETLAIPDSATFLEQPGARFVPEVLATRELSEVAAMSGNLTLQDRRQIVAQAIALLERHYVHLPLKQARHAVDPLQRLRLLGHELAQLDEASMGPELEFHLALSETFDSLRDLHTSYRLPRPFAGKIAWLPYLIEECWERGRSRYIVSKVIPGAGPSRFVEEVEVLHWNGTAIRDLVARLARRMPGGNQPARWARALNALTIRPLSRGQFPEEEWVTLEYRTADGAIDEYRQPWLVFEPATDHEGPSVDDLGAVDEVQAAAAAVGLDDHTDDIHLAKKALYASDVLLGEASRESRRRGRRTSTGGERIESRMPTVFRAQTVPFGDSTYGYLRVFSFKVSDADAFVDEFASLLRALPADGLILDVRGNGGGLIPAAERVLELISPRRIEPERAQFINTPSNLELCRSHERSTALPGLVLEPWIESISEAVATGATYSLGFPITDPGLCNVRGQIHQGPVVLIVDGLCYSATDMFAAGFKDHGIGEIIGVDENTGAGGANVWPYWLVQRLSAGDGTSVPLLPLPHSTGMRVAIRRTLRVGDRAGLILEDRGVRPDVRYRMKRDDLTNGNRSLIRFAAERLSGQRPARLELRLARDKTALVTTSRGVERIEMTVGGRHLGTRDVHRHRTRIGLDELTAYRGDTVALEAVGYRGDDPVVRVRRTIDVQEGALR